MPTQPGEVQNRSVKTYGTTLSYATIAATPVYTVLAGIREWKSLPKPSGSKTETTTQDGATAVPTKQYDPVDIEPGTLEVVLGFLTESDGSANMALLYPLFMVKKLFKITFADSSTHEQVGFIDEVGTEISGEKEVRVAVRVQFSGAATFTDPA